MLFVAIGWIGLVVGLLVGWLVTGLYRSLRADKRTAAFGDQLPDALQLVIGSLRSGFSLSQALDAMVRESPAPLSEEFGRALAEHRLGAELSDALEDAAKRVRSEDLEWAVLAVRIQREVGGNLAEVLQTTVNTIRDRGRLRRHVRSLSAEGRLSGWILVGLPIVLGTFMFTFRREYLRPLYTEPVGIVMLLIGVVAARRRHRLDGANRAGGGLIVSSSMLLYGGAGLAFAGLVLAVLTVAAASFGRTREARALSAIDARYTPGSVGPQADAFGDRVVTPMTRRVKGITRAVTGTSAMARLHRRLDYAGNPAYWTVERVFELKGLG